ncbi:MAG: Na(+)-translocating NADH-quinone reductase subunit A [Planctomycetota bacterium]|jgi:Na+-transporting NADH:ubiquinone oxidoreductase subunit A
MIRIRKGLNLPIAGEPVQTIEAARAVTEVALLGDDYVGMKPTMLVHEGDRVKLGQPVFADKKNPGVHFTAPGAGVVKGIHRGAKRKFESIVIELDGDEAETFARFDDISSVDREQATENLIASGLWTALRTRPFSRVPAPGSDPHAIFVTAMDTRPLAPDPALIVAEREADFVSGLKVLAKLTDGPLYVCRAPGAAIPAGDAKPEEFEGPHPAGLTGTHIHYLAPASGHRTVWSIGYQDVLAIGKLFTTGELDPVRVVSLAGPVVGKPRLLRTRLGARIAELTDGECGSGPVRTISGSVLDGRTAADGVGYLGRYHNQISAIADEFARPMLGWLGPGSDKYSVTRTFTSALAGAAKRFGFTTASGGDPRPIVPLGTFEKVLPLDMEPTLLLKALAVRDVERAEMLGALELDEEDLALCAFVDPGKGSFGVHLRAVLTAIEKEG